MDEINTAFGELLASLRKEAGFTQQELANMVGMSRSTIANIEGGKQSVVLPSIYSLAAALGRRPEELIPLISLESKIMSAIPDETNRELLMLLARDEDNEDKL